ncbi:2-C-methyl-D-erythritol 2,4-cyclodiphosphate synthase [Mobiluncus mulieris 28-1]|nr:2-C-methyl-D-erythritol 2,4-cyclodiphosphate synthase [Mobiluncus mulieris]EEZ92171.1 2-C-methyl-D-erythritol 2,4-cyclodiphosphate synthase [Mobiluncus mulieris 28-1]MCV0010991.1 2-C-methyl-D-erythritol 2,4-cyclodiphosphate synthase [Mobiluncus mulieris]PNL42598.1 2-C-methyl-D-erythritol 2,4-cyclodiphosphate synthase [Mobiluncus mulieris]
MGYDETMDLRVGQGFDAHRFARQSDGSLAAADPGQPLMIATLAIPDAPRLEGHSDGDVAAHALADALLSAADLGDLGSNFGVDRPEYAGAAGRVFLEAAMEKLRREHWEVVNASVQVIGQVPRLAPYYHAARAALSQILQAPVSFTATTTDRMGFTGNKEGLAALGICLLRQCYRPRTIMRTALRTSRTINRRD